MGTKFKSKNGISHIFFEFYDHGDDFHQSKRHKYIYDLLELVGGQGQMSRKFYGTGEVRKYI